MKSKPRSSTYLINSPKNEAEEEHTAIRRRHSFAKSKLATTSISRSGDHGYRNFFFCYLQNQLVCFLSKVKFIR